MPPPVSTDDSARPSRALRRIRADILDRARKAAEAGKRVKYEIKPADKWVVESAVDLLRLNRESRYPFALEGLLVAMIRSDRCALGWTYPYADASARAIVKRALQIAGLRRPPDNSTEGQRWHTDVGTRCQTCGGEIDGATTRRYFCSDECAIIATARRNAQEDSFRWGWEHAIRYSLKKKESPFRKCEQCETPYQGKEFSQYCSRKCSQIARRTIPDKECENCGKPFTPQRNEIRFCSRKCAGLEKKNREDLQCQAPGCTNYFKPRNISKGRSETSNRYCSQRCYWNAKRERIAA